MAAVAPSAVTFSKISYSAYGSDIKYLTDSAYFEGVRDGTTNRLSDTSIVYNSGLFNAFVELTSSYDTINFKAFMEKDEGKSSYLAELYASYLYLSTTADDDDILQKRRERTLTSSTDFRTSTVIDHSSFTVTSTQLYNFLAFYANTSSTSQSTLTSVGFTTLSFTNVVTEISESDTSTTAPDFLASPSVVLNSGSLSLTSSLSTDTTSTTSKSSVSVTTNLVIASNPSLSSDVICQHQALQKMMFLQNLFTVMQLVQLQL
ncbi:unnamed protein product [Ambrosiozyma monospora]|uniref:Unnamed protein product n=1 Tax=Ambrosiozyma monospora TaxID=43982 RepID=A0ACB5UCQ7_AMBMO|nr:unnamed protein product [Ambrosiozyma monospora]